MHIAWEARFETGCWIVDEQHQRMIDILNGLYRQLGEGRGEESLHKVFSDLSEYAETHFGTEERLLKRYAVAKTLAADHIAQQARYRERVDDYRQHHARGERLIPVQVLSFVSEWWLAHIIRDNRIFALPAGGGNSHGQ